LDSSLGLADSGLAYISGAVRRITAHYRVGYDSASQFNREYRRKFGLSPGRDATRLRGEPTLART
jgi:AraC-like DNA-binding protein